LRDFRFQLQSLRPRDLLDQREYEDLRARPGVVEEHWFHQRSLRLICVLSVPIPVLVAFYVSEQAKNLDYWGGTHAHGEPVISRPLLRTLTNRWLRFVWTRSRYSRGLLIL
jgi:hypothetical protein